jgi:hypothetical protein
VDVGGLEQRPGERIGAGDDGADRGQLLLDLARDDRAVGERAEDRDDQRRDRGVELAGRPARRRRRRVDRRLGGLRHGRAATVAGAAELHRRGLLAVASHQPIALHTRMPATSPESCA